MALHNLEPTPEGIEMRKRGKTRGSNLHKVTQLLVLDGAEGQVEVVHHASQQLVDAISALLVQEAQRWLNSIPDRRTPEGGNEYK